MLSLRIIICFLFFILLNAAKLSAGDIIHTFTNRDGSIIRASIVSVSDNTGKIKRSDGMTFTTDLNIYTHKDQAYIRKWAEEQAIDGANFTVSSSTVTGKKYRRKSGAAGHIETTTYDAHFKVTIENISAFHTYNDIELQYVIFKQPGSINVKTKDKPGLVSQKGTATIIQMPARGTYVFVTESFAMAEIKYNNYKVEEYVDGQLTNVKYKYDGDDYARDRLSGIWLKMYFNGRLLWEDLSHTSLANNKWPFDSTPAIKPPPLEKIDPPIALTSLTNLKSRLNVSLSTAPGKHDGTNNINLYLLINDNNAQKIKLDNPNINDFERGATDHFNNLHINVPIEGIHKITLLTTGGSDAWRLAKAEFQFRHARKLSKVFTFDKTVVLSADKNDQGSLTSIDYLFDDPIIFEYRQPDDESN